MKLNKKFSEAFVGLKMFIQESSCDFVSYRVFLYRELGFFNRLKDHFLSYTYLRSRGDLKPQNTFLGTKTFNNYSSAYL